LARSLADSEAVAEISDTDWSAILAAREGEHAALEVLVDKYRPAVVRFLQRRGLAAEAEDLAQEVFVRLIFKGALARVSPAKGRFRSLVLGVTRHVIGNHTEYVNALKRGGGQVVSLPDLDLEGPQADDAFDEAWVKNLVSQSLKILERDHPRYHQAIELFVFQGRTQAQVADALGVTRKDVKNRVHRGRGKLAELLRAEIRATCASPEEYEDELSALAGYLPE
jgi:RNA polymerase sigma factor (sigma-70 family)